MSSLEARAYRLGTDRKRLEYRLREARNCLVPELRAKFGRGRFNFREKRLESDCGKFAIVWRLRAKPDEPVSYENQQTSAGFIGVSELTPIER